MEYQIIENRESLLYYLNKDLMRFNKIPTLIDRLLKNEIWFIYKYQRHLRFYEYYLNTGKNRLFFYYHLIMYKRLGFRLKFTIYPNTIGPGLRIYHTGDFVHIKPNCKIGSNCTLLPGVVIGNKYLKPDNSFVTVGNNVYFGLGVKVFGNVTIGANAILGANSVILKDVPDNAIVSGIPARIIRLQNQIEKFV